MAFSRAAVLRSCFRARPSAARPVLRQAARRGYSSGHGEVKKGGDAVWAAGAVAVTIPSCWWILSNREDISHGHDDHGAAHGKSHDEEEHEEESKDEPEEKSEEASEDGDSKKSDDSESEDGNKDTPDTSDDESEKEPVQEDTKEEKKNESSSKDQKPSEADKPSANKPSGNKSTISGKQEGLSNTDTKHPEDPKSNPDQSTKGEGDSETAKVKGTVDPNRPQV